MSSESPSFIPLSIPYLAGNEAKYLQECVATNWVSSVGPFVDRFEKTLAAELLTPYAVATVNGTAALHIALLIAGVKPGEEVLVSDMTFIASVNAVRYAGAEPVFVDIEPTYLQMDVGLVANFLDNQCLTKNGQVFNRVTGRRIAAIVPVDVLGHPVDMDALLEVARRYQLPVIEDAAESLGARYKNRPCGGLADIGCLSFNGNKTFTAGGGGMILTHREDWGKHARHLVTQAKSDVAEYIHDEVGYNYRLTNIQAAVGCAQLENKHSYIEKKRHIAARYQAAFAGRAGLRLLGESTDAFSSFWLSTVLVEPTKFGLTCRELRQKLRESKIESRPLWQPIHLNTPYRDCQRLGGHLAEQAYAHALSLPSSVGLSEPDQDRVIAAVLTAGA